MPKYEIALLFDAGLEQAKINQSLADFEHFVSEHKGKIIEKELWPARDLAYQIKGTTKGIYFFAHYELGEEENPALIKELNTNQGILRQLITLPPEGASLKIEKVMEKGKRIVKEEKVAPKVMPKEEVKEEKIVEVPKIVAKKKEPVPVKSKVIEKPKVVPSKPKEVKEVEKVEEKKETPKTLEESKKAKAREQKAKKLPEGDLDQAIDKILSDEDLL